MFKGTPYEYAGRSYANPGSFKHYQIGTASAPNTGSGGPCIGCHMERPGLPGNHLFEPINSSVPVIVSSEICFNCHAGSGTSLGTVVQDERDNFNFALAALNAQLIAKGYTFNGSGYPYYSNTDWRSAGDTDTTGNTSGKNNMGAAFNYSILLHEPGAYVHNSRYVKRVIYDTLDWLDDGLMNYSVGYALSAGPVHSGQAWQAGAMLYLLPYGNLWQGAYPAGYGVDIERP